MIIEYLGHSAFYLKGESFSVVTDPFSGIGYDVKRVDCDYALSSHSHFDHSFFDGVNAGQRITQTQGIFKAIPCWHDEVCGAKRGQNNAFYFEMDGIKFLHLGDLGQPYSAESAKQFALPVDVLFVPIGGNYTIDAEDAVKYAKSIGARVTVAMHYKTKNSKIDIDLPHRFKELTGAKIIKNAFELTGESLTSLPAFLMVEFE